MKKIIFIIIIVMVQSCEFKNNKELDITLRDISFHKVIDWTGFSSISYNIEFKNVSKENCILGNDNILKFQLHENEVKTLSFESTETKKVLKPEESVVLKFKLYEFEYGDNLKEMINNNKELIESNYSLLFEYHINDIKEFNSINIKNKVIYNAFLDGEQIDINDSIKMNYYHKPLSPEEYEKNLELLGKSVKDNEVD